MSEKGKDDKDKKEPCVSAGSFEVKICEKKEAPPDKPKDKPKPQPVWQIAVALTIALTLSLQLGDNDSPTIPAPTTPVPRDSAEPPFSSSAPELGASPAGSIVDAPGVLQNEFTNLSENQRVTTRQVEAQSINLTDARSLESLHATLKQALISQEVEAIAPFIANSYYWIGDTRSPLDAAILMDAESPVMDSLDQAIAAGCVSHDSPVYTPAYWVCPGTSDVLSSEHFTPSKIILIDGYEVNVRQAASLDSEIITTASYQTVKLNQNALVERPEAEQLAFITESGWCPVILNDGQTGYVSSQFCRPITHPWALFHYVDGQWRMTVVTP